MTPSQFYRGQTGKKDKNKKEFDEFDCPVCEANNPYSDGFRAGTEIRCFYCGAEFRTLVDGNGKLKLREI